MPKSIFPGLAEPAKLKTQDEEFDPLDKPEQEPKEKGLLRPDEYFKLLVKRLKRIPNGLPGTDGLIRSHLKIVPRIAASMRKKPIYGLEPWWGSLTGKNKKAAAGGYGIVWEELTSAGFVGLMEAGADLDRVFNPEFAFSTFANPRIKKRIREEIKFLYQPVKRAGWSTSTTIVPNDFSEGAERDDRDAAFYDGSPDETVVVDDYQDETPLQRIELECRVEACTTLTPLERHIVEARLDEDYPTLRELAAELKFSHQRVHQLEEAAFEKIAATELPLSDLVRFYIRLPRHNIDDWLDAVTRHFYAKESWLVTRFQLLVMHWLAALGREDHQPQPLKPCEPEKKERFRGSDKLLTRCFIVSETGEVQHNSWLAPAHHVELPKEKKELWRKQSRNPLWRPKTYPGRQFTKEMIAAFIPSPKRTPFWAHSTFYWWAPDLNRSAARKLNLGDYRENHILQRTDELESA